MSVSSFVVIGADRTTGADKHITVMAETAADAEAIAIGRGMVVSQVAEVAGSPHPQSTQAVSPPASPPQSSPLKLVLRAVTGGIAGLALLLQLLLLWLDPMLASSMVGLNMFLVLVFGAAFLALFVNKVV